MATTSVADRCLSADKQSIDLAPMMLAITQLREEGSSWSEVLALVFGCRYDKETRLRSTKNNEAYGFVTQGHFDLFAKVLIDYVQECLRDQYHLVEMWVPEDTQGPKCNVFRSPDFFENPGRCLLLIQGAGSVRAGVWSRLVCADSLKTGSVFPALDFASAHNFSTLIFNPNMNCGPDGTRIAQNQTMQAHSNFLWKTYVRACPAQEIYILAHSCGGACTTALLKTFEGEFVQRVKAVAFTDSVHGELKCSDLGKEHLAQRSVHFVSSHLPLNTPIQSPQVSGSLKVSAGHIRHEYTTGMAMPGVVEFFEGMMTTGRNTFLK